MKDVKLCNNRIAYIDALRGYGALAVVLCHLIQRLSANHVITDDFITNYLLNGARAVQMFFILTGMTMFMSFEKNKGVSYANYLIKRYIRIFIPYLMAIAVYWCLGGKALFSTPDGFTPYSLKGVLLNALGLHALSSTYINSIVPGGWYIGVAWLYYLTVPLLFRWVNTASRAVKCMLIGLMLRIGTQLLSSFLTNDQMILDFVGMQLTSQFVFIAIGQFLYFVLVKKERALGYTDHGILVLFLLYVTLQKDTLMLWALVFTGVILVMALYQEKNILVNRFALFAGEHSMEIYLFHMAIVFFVCTVEAIHFQNTYLTIGVTYLISVVMVLGVSFVAHKLIKRCYALLLGEYKNKTK